MCEVVWQRWQFSWTKDGRPDRPYERSAWDVALTAAILVYEYGLQSNVGHATFYHAAGVSPAWAKKKRTIARVGRHLFY